MCDSVVGTYVELFAIAGKEHVCIEQISYVNLYPGVGSLLTSSDYQEGCRSASQSIVVATHLDQLRCENRGGIER